MVLGAVSEFAAQSFASEVLTLDQAIEEAKEHSPSVQRMRAAYEESKWRKVEAVGGGFMPKVTANATHYFDQKFEYINFPFNGANVAFPEIVPTTFASMDVSIPVFDGLANVNRVKSADLAKDAAENDLNHAEFELEENIRLAFYQALGAQQLEAVAQQNVKTLEDHLRISQVRKTNGSGTNYDVLRVEVQLNEARTDALNASDDVEITRRKLTQLLGLAEDMRPLQGDLPLPHPDSVQTLAVENDAPSRSDIKALDLRADAADQAHAAQAVWFVPKVSVGADYTFYNDINSAVNDTSAYRAAYSVGVSLQWNIFDGGVSIAQAKETTYQHVEAEKASEEAKLEVPYDLNLWKRKYLTNAARYSAKKLDVERSEESVRLAREEERAGTRNSTEVLDAELDLFRSKAGVVDALVSSAEAMVRLEQTLGRRI
jgi:outer membrane protein TolC